LTKLKAIIVDDERLARVNLKKLLFPHPEIEVAGEANSSDSAFDLIDMYNGKIGHIDHP
jgi:two-component system LytT family response regulator